MISFKLSFGPDVEGKARNRCADNWEDFADRQVTLAGGAWFSAPVAKDAAKTEGPEARHIPFHTGLQLALSEAGTHSVSVDAWRDRCARAGYFEDAPPGAGWKDRDKARADFRRAKADLAKAGWVEIDGETVRDRMPSPALSELLAA
jgi:hypothetical protein